MSEHSVKRKLRQEILPYLVSARRLKKMWYYRLHTFYSLWGDILPAAAAIGIGHPLLELLVPPGAENGETSRTLAEVLADSPPWLIPLGVVAVLLWIATRAVFNREEGQKRAVLARSCWRSFRDIEDKLHTILLRPRPVVELGKLVDEDIHPLVSRNRREEAWPWARFALNTHEEVEGVLQDLCRRYEENWEADPEHDSLQKPTARTMIDTPRIRAEFELDENGSPVFSESGGHKHYAINLWIESAPSDTHTVAYHLHESYYEPIREAWEPEDRFRQSITSYGDYTVMAKLWTRSSVEMIRSPLFEALSLSHADTDSPAIREALESIRNL